MNILVCGGAGYIGSHCVKMLLEEGHNVYVVDNLSTGYEVAIDERASFHQGDIRDFSFLNNFFSNNPVDCVVHFAAYSLVGVSMVEPLQYYNNNVHGTEVLLDAMVKNGVKNIVFSSTAATYGEHTVMPITEEYDTVPTNTYGETKLAMEKMMKWSDVAYGVKYVSLRYFNVAGAYKTGEIGESHNPETHLIPLILQVPLGKRESIAVFGDDYPTKDGTCIRDYIHVEDLVNAHILAIKYLEQGNNSDVFNLGSGEGYTVLEMIEAAREVTGHPIPAKVSPRRAGDPATLIASSAKAKRVLGWQPKYNDVKSIIESAWKFHSKNPNGFSKK